MNRMTWTAQLIDRVSGPARRIDRALSGWYTNMHQGRNTMGQFTEKATSLQSVIQGMQGPIGWAAAGLMTLGAAFAGVTYVVGKAAFEQFAFKESALATGKALWGSSEAADAMFKKASQIAKLTPFNVGEVVGAFNKLGAAGFGMEEVPVAFQGLSDIAAMSGKGAEAIGQMTLAFSQIMGKGHLAGQELNQITEAAGGAVSRMKLFGEIAKIMGTTTGSIESMMEQGLIPARVAIMGVMQISKQLGGGIVGQNSIEQSKTLGGLWSNLEDTLTNLWLTMDLSTAPWFGTVKGVLTNVIAMLDTSTASGKALQDTFGRIFANTIGQFAALATPEGLQKMGDVLEGVSHGLAVIYNVGTAAFRGLWDGMSAAMGPLVQLLGGLGETGMMTWSVQGTFETLGRILGYVATGFGVVFAVVAPIVGLFSRLLNLALRLTDALAGGLVQGLAAFFTGEWGQFGAIGRGMGTGIKEGFTESLGIRSPSRVFARYGENTVEGFNRGLDRVAGMDQTVSDDLLAGMDASGLRTEIAGGGAARAGGMAAPVSVSLNVNLNGVAGEGAESTAQRVAEVTLSTLANFFDQLAIERGVQA